MITLKISKAGFVFLVVIVNAVAAFVETGIGLTVPEVILIQTILNGAAAFFTSEELPVPSETTSHESE